MKLAYMKPPPFYAYSYVGSYIDFNYDNTMYCVT